jgi:hypothetical protein
MYEDLAQQEVRLRLHIEQQQKDKAAADAATAAAAAEPAAATKHGDGRPLVMVEATSSVEA